MSGTQRPPVRPRPQKWRHCVKKDQPIPDHQVAFEIDLGGDKGVVHLSPQAWAQMCYLIRQWIDMPPGDELIFVDGVPKVVSKTLQGQARAVGGTNVAPKGVVQQGEHIVP